MVQTPMQEGQRQSRRGQSSSRQGNKPWGKALGVFFWVALSIICLVGLRPYIWLATVFLGQSSNSFADAAPNFMPWIRPALNSIPYVGEVLAHIVFFVADFLRHSWAVLFGTVLWGIVIFLQILPVVLFGQEQNLHSIIASISRESHAFRFEEDKDDGLIIRGLKQQYNNAPTQWVRRIYSSSGWAVGVDFLICSVFYEALIGGWTMDNLQLLFSRDATEVISWAGFGLTLIAVLGVKAFLEQALVLSKAQNYAVRK